MVRQSNSCICRAAKRQVGFHVVLLLAITIGAGIVGSDWLMRSYAAVACIKSKLKLQPENEFNIILYFFCQSKVKHAHVLPSKMGE